MAEDDDVTIDFSEESLSIPKFVLGYATKLPQIVKLTYASDCCTGWYAANNSNIADIAYQTRWTDAEQVMRVVEVFREDRVSCRNVATGRQLSIPLSCQDQFIVQHSMLKQRKTLSSIIQKHRLPVDVEHKPADSKNKQSLTLTEFRVKHYLAVNFIRRGELDRQISYIDVDNPKCSLQVAIIPQQYIPIVLVKPQHVPQPDEIFDTTPVHTGDTPVHTGNVSPVAALPPGDGRLSNTVSDRRADDVELMTAGRWRKWSESNRSHGQHETVDDLNGQPEEPSVRQSKGQLREENDLNAPSEHNSATTHSNTSYKDDERTTSSDSQSPATNGHQESESLDRDGHDVSAGRSQSPTNVRMVASDEISSSSTGNMTVLQQQQTTRDEQQDEDDEDESSSDTEQHIYTSTTNDNIQDFSRPDPLVDNTSDVIISTTDLRHVPLLTSQFGTARVDDVTSNRSVNDDSLRAVQSNPPTHQQQIVFENGPELISGEEVEQVRSARMYTKCPTATGHQRIPIKHNTQHYQVLNQSSAADYRAAVSARRSSFSALDGRGSAEGCSVDCLRRSMSNQHLLDSTSSSFRTDSRRPQRVIIDIPSSHSVQQQQQQLQLQTSAISQYLADGLSTGFEHHTDDDRRHLLTSEFSEYSANGRPSFSSCQQFNEPPATARGLDQFRTRTPSHSVAVDLNDDYIQTHTTPHQTSNNYQEPYLEPQTDEIYTYTERELPPSSYNGLSDECDEGYDRQSAYGSLHRRDIFQQDSTRISRNQSYNQLSDYQPSQFNDQQRRHSAFDQQLSLSRRHAVGSDSGIRSRSHSLDNQLSSSTISNSGREYENQFDVQLQQPSYDEYDVPQQSMSTAAQSAVSHPGRVVIRVEMSDNEQAVHSAVNGRSDGVGLYRVVVSTDDQPHKVASVGRQCQLDLTPNSPSFRHDVTSPLSDGFVLRPGITVGASSTPSDVTSGRLDGFVVRPGITIGRPAADRRDQRHSISSSNQALNAHERYSTSDGIIVRTSDGSGVIVGTTNISQRQTQTKMAGQMKSPGNGVTVGTSKREKRLRDERSNRGKRRDHQRQPTNYHPQVATGSQLHQQRSNVETSAKAISKLRDSCCQTDNELDIKRDDVTGSSRVTSLVTRTEPINDTRKQHSRPVINHEVRDDFEANSEKQRNRISSDVVDAAVKRPEQRQAATTAKDVRITTTSLSSSSPASSATTTSTISSSTTTSAKATKYKSNVSSSVAHAGLNAMKHSASSSTLQQLHPGDKKKRGEDSSLVWWPVDVSPDVNNNLSDVEASRHGNGVMKQTSSDDVDDDDVRSVHESIRALDAYLSQQDSEWTDSDK